MHAGLWCEDLRERDHLKDLGVDLRITLKWILAKLDCYGLGYGQVKRACEINDEHSCCIKCGKILD